MQRALLVNYNGQQITLTQEDIIRVAVSVREDQKKSLGKQKLRGWAYGKTVAPICLEGTVNINERGEGKVVLYFSSPEEVDWLVNHFAESIDIQRIEKVFF